MTQERALSGGRNPARASVVPGCGPWTAALVVVLAGLGVAVVAQAQPAEHRARPAPVVAPPKARAPGPPARPPGPVRLALPDFELLAGNEARKVTSDPTEGVRAVRKARAALALKWLSALAATACLATLGSGVAVLGLSSWELRDLEEVGTLTPQQEQERKAALHNRRIGVGLLISSAVLLPSALILLAAGLSLSPRANARLAALERSWTVTPFLGGGAGLTFSGSY